MVILIDNDKVLAVFFGISIFILLSTVLHTSTHIPVEVGYNGNVDWDRPIRVCPPREIYREVSWVVNRWNKAIQYFGYRYLWLDALRYRFTVSSSENECDVSFNFIEEPPGKCIIKVDGDEWIPVAVLNFKDGKAVINIWVEALREDLREDLKRVLVHELAWALGLHIYKHAGNPGTFATDTIGMQDVTSMDVFALYIKARGIGRLSGRTLYYYTAPPYVPVLTIEDALVRDVLSLYCSIAVAFILYKALNKMGGGDVQKAS